MGGCLAVARITLTCLPAITNQRMFLLVIIALQPYYMLHCSLFKTIRHERPTGIPSFLFRGLNLQRLCLVSPSSLWHGLNSVYFPTAPVAPSLRPLIQSGSLTRCKLVQVYHHQPRSMVLMDPVYHIIYLGDYFVWALPWGLELGLGNTATLCRTHGRPRSWPVCRNEFSSSHWPTLGADRDNSGCHIDGPMN
jgi:hypothetical protein